MKIVALAGGVGGAKLANGLAQIQLPEDLTIIVNTGDGFVALSSVCTHLGCQVTYNQSSGNLPCPCHGSVFSITGSVLNGPASSPLEQYNVTQEGDILTIAL